MYKYLIYWKTLRHGVVHSSTTIEGALILNLENKIATESNLTITLQHLKEKIGEKYKGMFESNGYWKIDDIQILSFSLFAD